MKKRKAFILLIAALAMIVSGAMLGCSGKPEIVFADEGTNLTYVSDGDYYFADFGTPVVLPKTEVRKGETVLDATVDIVVTDNGDRRVPLMGLAFSPAKNAEYKIVFSSEGSGAASKTISVRCADVKGPSATFGTVRTGAVAGDVISLPKFMLDDPSGVDETKTSVSVSGPSGTVSISTSDGEKQSVTAVTGEETFTVTEIGKYVISIKTADKLGNEKIHTIDVIATEAYVDEDAPETTLFAFDDRGYERLVYLDEGEANFAVATSDLPAGGKTDGMLKIDVPEDKSARLFFNGFKNINADTDNVGEIRFNIYSTGILADFTVYGADGKTVLLTKKYRRAGWNEFSFNARTVLGWTGEFEDFYISFACEDAVSVYIDEIGYEKLFKDTVLGENVLADFDEAGYIGLVSQNGYSNTAQFEIVQKADVAAEIAGGMTGGALKVTADASMEGFKVLFDKPVAVSDLGSLTVRMYFDKNADLGRIYENSRWGFITEKGAETGAMWGDRFSGVVPREGWFDYRFSGANVTRLISAKGGASAIGFYFAFVETSSFKTDFYVDEISYTDKYDPTSDVDYKPFDDGKQLYKIIETDADFGILDNIGTTNLTHPAAYPSVSRGEYGGAPALAFAKNSAYVGAIYTLPQVLTFYNDKGVMDKGSLWTAIAFEGSEYQKASARISFVGGNDSFTFGSFGAGINYLPVPFESIMSAGVNSIGGINLGVSGGAYKFLGFYYDLAVTEALPETGTTEVYNGETITKIADTVGDKYLAAFRRSGYTDKTGSYSVLPAIASAENGEKLTFAAGRNAGAEFTIKDFRLGSKNGSRVGNRLYIEVDFPAAATGTLTYGVKTANGKYVTAEISDPTAGAHKLELFVPDILDVNYFMRSVLFAGSFETETAFTVRKIYIDEYRELLGTPAAALRGGESGASIVWNAVEGATKYAVTNSGGTTEEIAATSIKVTQAGLYTVQALSDTLYSKKSTVYGEPNYGKLDLTAGGYILGEFDAKGADRNWTAYVGPVPWGTNQTPIIGTGSATNGTMTAQGVTVKALDDANWAAAYYALPETVKVRDAYTIGFNILTPDPWGNCQFNNEIFGVRIGGVYYFAGAGNAFWRSGSKKGSEIVFGAEKDFTANYIGNSNSPVMRVQIVISALGLPAGSENAEIEGVFYGLKKANTVYVDSIFYTVDGGNAEIKYDGAPVKDKYYTNETFDFTRFTAAVNGGTQSAFKFTATKDGQPFAIPSGETTLEAGEYTITAIDRASAVAGSGLVSFTVAPPQSGTLAVSYGKADIFVNETFDMSALAVTGGKEGMTYEYVITLPSGDTAQLTDGYALASGGKYTVTVTGRLRGYVYVGSCEITVASAQTVELSIPYGGATELSTGDTLNKSDFTPSFVGETRSYNLVIEYNGTQTDFSSDSFALADSGVYKVIAIVTERGFEGSAEITLTVYTSVADLAIERNGIAITAFTTSKDKTYDLTKFAATSSVAGASDGVKWTISDGTAVTPLDMTNKSFAFGKNGTFTIKAAPDETLYFKGNAAEIVVTVEDIKFNVADGDKTILADFSNEGYNLKFTNVTADFGTFYEKSALRFKTSVAWNENGVKYTFPQAITLKRGDKLVVEYYKDVTNKDHVMYANFASKSSIFSVSLNKTWFGGTVFFATSDFALDSILINYNTANAVGAISRIFIEKADLSDLPDGETLVTGGIKRNTADWGRDTDTVPLQSPVTLTRNSIIGIKFRTKTTENLYIGINDLLGTKNGELASLGIGVLSAPTVVSVALSDTKFDKLFASSDTVEMETLRLGSYEDGQASKLLDVEWVSVRNIDYDNTVLIRNTRWSATAGTIYGQTGTGTWPTDILGGNTRTINKNGKLLFCINTSTNDSVTVYPNEANPGVNGYSIKREERGYAVVEIDISAVEKWAASFDENGELTLTKLIIQLAPSSTNPNKVSINWIAYVPPATE